MYKPKFLQTALIAVGLLMAGTLLNQNAHTQPSEVSFKNNTHQKIQLTWTWFEGKSQKTLSDPVTLSLASDNSAQKKEIDLPSAVQHLLKGTPDTQLMLTIEAKGLGSNGRAKDASPFILKGTLGNITKSLQKGFVIGLNKSGSQYTFTYAD